MVNDNRIQNMVHHPTQLSHTNGSATNGHGTRMNAMRRAPKSQGYDWLGAVLRRKGILLFSIAVSAILGYLYFLRQPKVYASSLKLMIWTQVPPRLTDSDPNIQPVSTGKYVHLMSGQTVLEKAVEKGDLNSLRTFGGNASGYWLKGMLQISPVDGAADTLWITARGPVPEELPVILTAVVASFEDELSKGSAAFNKDAEDLFKSMQEKLLSEKSTTEERFRELIQKLGISPDPNTRQYANPYDQPIAELKALKQDAERELRDANERLSNMADVFKQPPQTRGDSLRVLAIEASKYLDIQMKTDASGNISNDETESEVAARIAKVQARVESLEERLEELRLEQSRIRRTVGDKHPSATAISEKCKFHAAQLNTQQELLRQLKSDVLKKEKTNLNAAPKNAENAGMNITNSDVDLIKFFEATLDRAVKRLNNSIASLDNDIAELEKKAEDIRGDVEELNVMSQRIRDTDQDLKQTLDKLSTLTVFASNYNGTKVTTVDRPGVGGQVEPKLYTIMASFIFSGGLIGFALVALLDWADLSYRNPEEIKERLGLPVVARISKMDHSGRFKDGHAETLVTVDKPKSPVAEAYRACRTAMLFMARQQNLKCFLITSPAAGDGKSTTSLNLAMCFAQGGLKTVIVDADLRRPRCHAYMGLEPSPGLKDFSVGDATAEGIVRQTSLHQNLHIVTAGRHFSNPSQFIDSAQFADFLHGLREKFDIVIVDSPPVLPVADAMALSSVCDGVLLVIKIRKGVVLSSEKACDTLRSVNANILGVVVNQVEKMSHYSDYGKYGYNGYGGYAYYAGRYYGKANDKYYENEPAREGEPENNA